MAIAMQQRMRDLQAEWRERGQEHVFQLRIGINTGFCTVGNFGSDDRIDYTIIGNEVNLAARLQSHADLGGILLAHETYALVKDAVLTEETGTITVKGFPTPVQTLPRRRPARRRADRGASSGRSRKDCCSSSTRQGSPARGGLTRSRCFKRLRIDSRSRCGDREANG